MVICFSHCICKLLNFTGKNITTKIQLVNLPRAGDLALAAGDFLGDFPLGDLGLAGDLGETAFGEAFLGR